MNADIAEKLSVKVSCGVKNSSGTIYVNGDTCYIFTAKHSICPKSVDECQSIKRECNTCELKNTYKSKVTTIIVDKVGASNLTITPKKVIHHKNKDLAILVLKNKDIPSVTNLPDTKISSINDIDSNDRFVTCGYPFVTGNDECQPIHYSEMSKFGLGINLQIEGNAVSNLEPAKDNLSANSGAGIIKKHGSKNLLAGIYTKTGDISACFGEYFDHTVNDLLISSGLPPLIFDGVQNEISTLIKSDFLKCFTKIKHDLILGDQRQLNLFTIKLDGKNLEYDNLKERLNECIRLFTLPRKLIKQYESQSKNKKAVKEGDRIFLELRSDNKVAELLLQGFLESHLNAPKLYSFIGSNDKQLQSVHIRFIDAMSCELVYSTAKMGLCLETTLLSTLNDVLQAIPDLNGVGSLFSNHLFDSTFDNDEQAVLGKLLLPSEGNELNNTSNSFSIFIGFDFKSSDSIRYKNIPEFNQYFQSEIVEKVRGVLNNIKYLLDRFDVVNSELNCYLVPFTDTKEFCQSFLEDL
jgi:hypothetical protein